MTPTPTDPTAIDLDEIRSNWSLECPMPPDLQRAIAAVEALRDDLAGYDTVFDLARERERPWIEKWRIARAKPDTLPDYGEMLNWVFGQIEAAEARVAGLEAAAEIAESIDSGRGNEKEIAKAIRALAKDGP